MEAIATLALKSFIPLPFDIRTTLNESCVFFWINVWAVNSLISSSAEFVPNSVNNLIAALSSKKPSGFSSLL